MKKVLKKVLFEITKYVLITCVLYGCIFTAHQITGMDAGTIGLYATENSEISSESFERFRVGNYAEYELLVSDEHNKHNELWIFEKTDNSLFSMFHLSGRFKRTPYMHVTSEKDIANIYFDLHTGGFDETALLYYSHNKDNIALCKYTRKSDDGYIEEIEHKLNPYCSFVVFVPCTKNGRTWTYEIQKVSFYDNTGKLIFEDIRNT